MFSLSRRDFLKLSASSLLAASGILSLAGLLQFLGHPTNPAPQTEFDLGPPENYPPGSRTVVANGSALLIHAESGFHALSLTCTHLGCTVEPRTGGFTCPCHGSTFDVQGNPTQGPAQKPLRMLRIETSQTSHLILHTE